MGTKRLTVPRSTSDGSAARWATLTVEQNEPKNPTTASKKLSRSSGALKRILRPRPRNAGATAEPRATAVSTWKRMAETNSPESVGPGA